jgi:hypothetical protein
VIDRLFGEDHPILSAPPEQNPPQNRTARPKSGWLTGKNGAGLLVVVMMMVMPVVVTLRLGRQSDTRHDGKGCKR